MHDEHMSEGGLNRRSLIKRAAVTGAATAWATPTIQSIASPAFATGTPAGACGSCITGGGNNILGGSWTLPNGTIEPLESISVGMGQICCVDNGPPSKQNEVTVTLHPVNKKLKDKSFGFRYDLAVVCTKTGNPAPPTHTADCANHFEGTLTDGAGNTLRFMFEDNGEPGVVDRESIQIDGVAGHVLGAGTLANGNLQVHEGLGPIEHDCSGC